MLKMFGALLLACAAFSWCMALVGECQVAVGASLSLMFSGLALALVPWWTGSVLVAPAAAEEVSAASEVPFASMQASSLQSSVSNQTVSAAGSEIATGPIEQKSDGTPETATPFESVPAIVPEILAPARGEKTEIRRAYNAYVLACQRSGAKAVPPVEFVPLMQILCSLLKIETRRRGDFIYLLDVRIT
ncbi:MAG: hypothetical protein JSR78_08540 [Proteobacteria bacterium]|nr:hypothetical protein [Pseudomonadota bacterium]